MLRIRDVIPDPNFFHPGARIRIKEFKYFKLKNVIRDVIRSGGENQGDNIFNFFYRVCCVPYHIHCIRIRFKLHI
jgi:hypothetical protein